MNKEERFKNIISKGEDIEIIYLGGKLPGSKRKIKPLSIKDRYLYILCLHTNKLKNLMLDKIKFPDEEDKDTCTYLSQSKKTFLTTEDFALSERKKIENNGLQIYFDESSIEIRKSKKKGGFYKNPCCGISYWPEAHDFFDIDENGDLVEQRKKSQKPWRVYGFSSQSRSYKTFHAAAEALINLLSKDFF